MVCLWANKREILCCRFYPTQTPYADFYLSQMSQPRLTRMLRLYLRSDTLSKWASIKESVSHYNWCPSVTKMWALHQFFISQHWFHWKAPLRRDLCLELLAWRYLEHRFILPLLGVFEEESRLFLVSPLMVNGTLTNWRKNQTPIVAEIHQVVKLHCCDWHSLAIADNVSTETKG